MRRNYLRLFARIQELSNELLPAVRPTANYTKGEVLRILAFRLSVHAEIEGFLEQCAVDFATYLAELNNAGKLSTGLCGQIVQHKYWCDYPPKKVSNITTNAAVVVSNVLNSVQAFAAGNNGVTEKDILKLFVPLGMEIGFFSHSWLAAMNDLARARGETAHASWLSGGISQPTPNGERARLIVPLLGLRHLVDEISRIRSIAQVSSSN